MNIYIERKRGKAEGERKGEKEKHSPKNTKTPPTKAHECIETCAVFVEKEGRTDGRKDDEKEGGRWKNNTISKHTRD